MPLRQNIWPPAAKAIKKERPISDCHKSIDSDLARDNLENDLPEADKNDL